MTITPEAIVAIVTVVLAILTEVLARMVPTDKNYSWVQLLVKVLDGWVKNKSTEPNTVYTISKVVEIDPIEESIS